MILIATLLSIVAALCVARGKSLIANVIWSVTNIIIIHYNYCIGEMEMAFLFGVYQLISLYGIWNLGLKLYYRNYVKRKKCNFN